MFALRKPIKKNNSSMEKIYKSPQIEVLEIEIEDAILQGSSFGVIDPDLFVDGGNIFE